MPDAIFENSRLAEIYDNLEADRYDLDHYVAIAEEFGVRSVIDIGCGTGTLAVRLALDGLAVTAVDPAEASLVVARRKPGADRVQWILGDATALPPMAVDLVLMTGNVAQVFVDDDAWHAALRSSYEALRPGGRLVFEVRDPSFRGWEEWTPEASMSTTDTVHGPVESWVQLTCVDLPLVSFRWTFRFLDDDITLESDSILRFRSKAEIVSTLRAARFDVDDVREAPDRPGREFVVVARRGGS